MSRPKPKYKPAFVPRWTASPDLRAWPPVPFRDVYPVGGRAGANWQTVACNWSVDVADLIWFNFGTNDPRRINWYLHYYVGCHKSNDGKNFSFREADPGLIYIPPDNWKRPETVPSLNNEVAGILAPLVAHFPRDVALSGLHVTRGDFVAVVHAVRTGRISIVHQRSLPYPAIYLPQRFGFAPENSIVMKDLPASTPLMRNNLVHEAVHAISDMKVHDIFHLADGVLRLRHQRARQPFAGSCFLLLQLMACLRDQGGPRTRARDQGRRRWRTHRSL